MILGGLEEMVQDVQQVALPWLDRVVDALIRTWEAVPLAQRWTLGMFVVVMLVLSKWFLPAIAKVIAALRGQVDRSGVFKKKE